MFKKYTKSILFLYIVFAMVSCINFNSTAANIEKLNLKEIGATISGTQQVVQNLSPLGFLSFIFSVPLIVHDIPIVQCEVDKIISGNVKEFAHVKQNTSLWNILYNTTGTFLQIDLQKRYSIDDINLSFAHYINSPGGYAIYISDFPQLENSWRSNSSMTSFYRNHQTKGRYVLINLYGAKLFETDLLIGNVDITASNLNE